jgi:hypothetical protein
MIVLSTYLRWVTPRDDVWDHTRNVPCTIFYIKNGSKGLHHIRVKSMNSH